MYLFTLFIIHILKVFFSFQRILDLTFVSNFVSLQVYFYFYFLLLFQYFSQFS